MSDYADILLVEDNYADMQLTMRVLSETPQKPNVYVARDGEQALKLIFGQDHLGAGAPIAIFTLVLLDLKLPKISGLEVLKELKANRATTSMPVVIFSSSKQVTDLDACYQLGANGYVQKPVAFEAFEDAVRHIAAYWLGANLIASPAAFCEIVRSRTADEQRQCLS